MSGPQGTLQLDKPKVGIIVNERAGAGAMADIFRRVEHRLEDALGDFEVAFTDAPGHATRLARDLIDEGIDVLVVAGGDGTLNEVVNGYLDADGSPRNPNAALAVLGGGTGGDFRRTLRIANVDEAVAAILGGRTQCIDAARLAYRDAEGRSTQRYFINVTSFGLSGEVIQHMDRFRGLGGRLGYAGATLRALWGWSNPQVRLRLDGDLVHEGPLMLGAVANGRFFGGGMMIAPEARLDSGQLQLVSMGGMSRVQLLMLTRSIYDGAHVYHPDVQVRSGAVIEAESLGAEVVYLDIDGETGGQLPARFEIIPRVVRCVVP